MIWLSRLWHAIQFPFGDAVTAGIECIDGSAMYFIVTGIPNSHTRRDLSSDVVAKRRPSSQT